MAVNDAHDRASLNLARTATLILIAVGIHCTLDGLDMVSGDNLPGHPDLGLLAGLSVHKLSEGMALILFFLGAGF